MIQLTDDWCREQLRAAYKVALDSPDTSTQNGALVFDGSGTLVGSGCNTFTYGMPITPDLLERPKKYAYIEHAERNSIFSTVASRLGGRPLVMVCPWAACADCARAIVQAGIGVLVRHRRDDATGRWGGSIEDGDRILAAGEVKVITITGDLGGCDPVLFAGEPWAP